MALATALYIAHTALYTALYNALYTAHNVLYTAHNDHLACPTAIYFTALPTLHFAPLHCTVHTAQNCTALFAAL